MKTLIAVAVSAIAVFGAVAETIILQPGVEGKDAVIVESQPDNNTGDGIFIQTGYDSVGKHVSLVEWDISSIPEYSEITGAEMELYCAYLYGDLEGEIELSLITESWEEMGVTWDSRPEYSDDVATTGDWPAEGTWAAFDVTEFVAGWYAGDFDNYGLWGAPTASGYDYRAIFYSSDYTDGGLRPKLTITYEVHDPDEAVEPASLGTVKAVYR